MKKTTNGVRSHLQQVYLYLSLWKNNGIGVVIGTRNYCRVSLDEILILTILEILILPLIRNFSP